jgi:ABC-2 type transport system permease protein
MSGQTGSAGLRAEVAAPDLVPATQERVSGVARLRPLLAYLLRGQIVPAAIWGGVLGLFGFLYVALFPSMGSELDQYIESLPEGMKAFFPTAGVSESVEAWLHMEQFSMVAPLALPFFVIIMGARAIAGREERGRLDLLLSNPVPRWVLVVATYLTMIGGLTVVLVLTHVLTWVAAPLFDVDLSAVALLEGVLNLLPISLAFGALALLLSAVLHRSTVAIVVPGLLLVGMYIVYGLGNYSEAIEPLQPLSIFHYYGAAITEGLDWPAFAGVLLLSSALTALAVLGFQRREIYT